MDYKTLNKYLLPYSILFLAFYSVIGYLQAVTGFSFLNITAVWWFINFIILYAYYQSRKFNYNPKLTNNDKTVKWLLIWTVISILRGFFVAETYWDWKILVGNSMAILLPLVTFTAANILILRRIISFYYLVTLPLFVLLLFILPTDVFGFYLMPVTLLIVFFPILNKRWQIIVSVITILILIVDFDARSNIIKFLVPIGLLLLYYVRKFISIRIIEIIRKSLLISPFILFFLGVTGIFNVFKMDEYIKGQIISKKENIDGVMVEVNVKADTRTFIYEEVLYTANKYNTWLIGRSPARGNISDSFGGNDMNGRNERAANEAAIPNVFMWTGLIGVALYFIVFYKASYIAINKSRNIFSKLIGLYVAFRWLYSWVEDINNFSLNYFMLWVLVGLCLSTSFNNMTNSEVRIWVRGIFDIKYRSFELLNTKSVDR